MVGDTGGFHFDAIPTCITCILSLIPSIRYLFDTDTHSCSMCHLAAFSSSQFAHTALDVSSNAVKEKLSNYYLMHSNLIYALQLVISFHFLTLSSFIQLSVFQFSVDCTCAQNMLAAQTSCIESLRYCFMVSILLMREKVTKVSNI